MINNINQLKIVLAKKQEEFILENLLQKYLYEMSRYYDTEMDSDGNYAYPYLQYYFHENDRQAFFIYNEEKLVGFALVNTHSFTEPKADNCLAEFNIFPMYRRLGYGREAIKELFKIRRGVWQLKYSPRNTSGASFWRKIAAEYRATEHRLNDDEIALSFDV